ncbi:MAG: hypothetical protein E4H14_00230 [Candidatus Thorarchaeota archaeon]|nr:MAG: hypothetical protein E4H14_00230 [Candidatus Thorarchaeota archaeon]
MSLREDNGPYCLVWLGMLLMGAYYTNFAYLIYTSPPAAASFFALFIPFMLLLLILPPVMTFLFTGYLRPTRGKAKMTMFSLSVVTGLFFVIFANLVSLSTDMLGNLLVFSSWGIGSAILTAGGFSIAQSYAQSTSLGMLDVSSLHYGPPKVEPEPEPEPVVETPTEEPEVSSEEEKPEEPVSE